jgi:hypothetical protein
MAGIRINDYGIGDPDLTSLMETTDNQRIGRHAVSLTEFATTNKPKIAQGSRIEVNGSLFLFDESGDEDISGSPSDGVVYIKLTPAGETISASFTNDAPTWDDEKQGWYETSTNNRYLNFWMIKNGDNYYHKYNFENKPEIYVYLIIEIGDWDMNASATVTVAHNLGNAWKSLRHITAFIRNDDDDDYRPLNSNTSTAQHGGVGNSDATNVILVRLTGGNFDSVNYDSTSYNRGWINLKLKII